MTELLKLKTTGLRRYLVSRAHMRSLGKWLPKPRYGEVTRLGRSLRVDRDDLEQASFEADCIREPENIFLFRALARQGMCDMFVDVGANFGHIALKVLHDYGQLILVDANPMAVAFLRDMFDGQEHVDVRHQAIVDDPAIESVTLIVPGQRSGLGHVGMAHDAAEGEAYPCPAITLDRLLGDHGARSTYIKIDVEGYEPQVLRGGVSTLARSNVIVGFEAWSRDAAAVCCGLLQRHAFYFARFDFLDRSGAMMSSWAGLARAFTAGGGITIHRFSHLDQVPFDHFSQIIAVPLGAEASFEAAIRAEAAAQGGRIDLGRV